MTESHFEKRYCSLLRRLLAISYDAVIMIGLLMIATLIALPVTGPNVRAGLDAGFSLYLLLVSFAYFGGCWRYSSATLGMRAWRVRLVSRSGPTPKWSACLLRFLIAIASVAAAGLGFLWALFDRQKRCWHDLATGSYLVVVSRKSDRTP